MDEIYIKVKGIWRYLYRAVDNEGKTIDFLLTASLEKAAAMHFFEKAIRDNGIPEKVSIDKNGANTSAIDQINVNRDISVIVRKVKYLNNIAEQDHRAIKRITKPMLGFKSFHAAKNVLAWVERMHMIRKGNSICTAAKSCLLLINFMRWQEKSVQRKCEISFCKNSSFES